MVSSWTHNFIAPHTSPCDLRLGQFFDIFSFHCLFINVDNSRDTWNGDGNKKGAFNKFLICYINMYYIGFISYLASQVILCRFVFCSQAV